MDATESIKGLVGSESVTTEEPDHHPRYPAPVFLWWPRRLTNGKIRWLCTVNKRWWRDKIGEGTMADRSGWIYEQ